jgi:acetolactate synthase-1/2/3 large subunit
VDFRAMFTPLAKWVAEIRDANRIPEYVARAFHVAASGRPGPVVLSLPEDVLSAMCTTPATKRFAKTEPVTTREIVRRAHGLIMRAERPFLVLGGPGWDADATADIRKFAEILDLPVITAFRAKDRFDNTHRNYCGDLGIGADPKLVARVKESDLLLVVGARLGDMTTDGYTRVTVPNPKQTLIHVHPGVDELARVYQPDLAIASGVAPFARLASEINPPVSVNWRSFRREARADYETFTRPVSAPGDVNPSHIFAWLSEKLTVDAILANGAGNYASWLHRFYLYRGYPTLLGPTSGAMGYGVPAAIAAKLLYPSRTVDDRTGTGNRRAIRRCHHCPRLRQRDVRHHPHASGTRIPRPGDRNKSQESRLRGTGAKLWRRGFSCDAHGRLRRCVSARAPVEKAFAHPYQRRSGSDFTDNDADGVERECEEMTLFPLLSSPRKRG